MGRRRSSGTACLAALLFCAASARAETPPPVPSKDPLALTREPLSSTAAWESGPRAEILREMERVMGPLPRPAERCALEVRVEEQVDCGTYTRQFLTYQSEAGSRVPAYLLLPKAAGGEGQISGVLALHQTHRLGHKVVVGLGQSPNDEYGVELAERGYAVLAPAYPLLAEYAPDLKKLGYQSGTMKAVWDNIRGLDLLESLPRVRPGSFAVIGHSLGGHNGLFTAAFEPRLKIAVSSCGFDSFRDYMGGKIKGWTSERYMPRLLDFKLEQMPFDFHQVLAAIAPRAVFASAPLGDSNFHWWSVDRVARAARPVFELYGSGANLRVEHPDAGHVFPKEMREKAYEEIRRALK